MDARTLSTQELLRLCLQSDEQEAWLEFVRRFQPFIARVVMKTLSRVRYWKKPTPQEIDDLVQDTFLKLCANNFQALRNFDYQHENALFGFAKVVASNVVQDYLRNYQADKRGSGLEEEDLEKAQNIAASGFGGPGIAERNVLIGEIRGWLETQGSDPNFRRCCVIFWLYYQQGLTAKAISDLPGIGLTVKGVESCLLRMIRLIREGLGGSGKAEAAGSGG
jgi:RNA polymerase sigma-70 factor, ECF subfamily